MWQQIREFLLRNTVISVAALAMVILAAGWYVWAHSGGESSPVLVKAYFYDEKTKETVVRSADDVPPLIGSGGAPTLVRAVYYITGGNTEKKLAYLEKYTDSAKAALDKQIQLKQGPVSPGDDPSEQGRLVRIPDDGAPWVKANSDQGVAVMERMYQDSPDRSRTRIVTPD